jgi:phosphoribosylformimino-5-aminoimidazole carboxamide ribotide isomerase
MHVQVIPVIDLIAGQVVHARLGQRDSYAPIRTPLAPGSAPLDVVRGLLALHPFSTLYIADLDSIRRRGDNRAVIAGLREANPAVRLWVDGGLADLAACRGWLAADLGDVVIGSESQRDMSVLSALTDAATRDRVILSLDHQGDRFLGPSQLLADPSVWPERVIVMTLARVGSGAGPDIERFEAIRQKAGPVCLYAAGGIRGLDDLVELARRGASGVLVATALHDGRIGPSEIAAVL